MATTKKYITTSPTPADPLPDPTGQGDKVLGRNTASDAFEYKDQASGGGGGSGVEVPAIDASDIHQWCAGGVSGGTVADQVGSDDLTANENSAHATGTVDAVEIVATDDASGVASTTCRYETAASPSVPDDTNGYTISGWYRLATDPASFDRLIVKSPDTTWNSGNPDFSFGINFQSGSSGLVEAVLNGGGTSPSDQTVVQNPVDHYVGWRGEWVHIGVVVPPSHSGDMLLYVNGNLAASTAVAAAVTWGTGPWTLGGRLGATSERLDGHLYDWRVAETVRDAAWFKDAYLGGRAALNGGVAGGSGGTAESELAYQLTGDETTLEPTGWDTATLVVLSTDDDDYTVSNLGAASVVRKTLVNADPNGRTITLETGGNIVTHGSDFVLAPNDIVSVVYDATNSVWRIY